MSFDNEFFIFFALLFALCFALAIIDIRQGIIPNWLNLAIAGIGIAEAATTDGLLACAQALCEGILVGGVFWLLQRFYFSLRKVRGLGLGDVKFIGAAGIWIGFIGIPVLLLVASLTALLTAGIMKLAGRTMTGQTALPFGPFLAIGLLFALAFKPYG
ncbi:prepilin peptidase [Bradyrhizobium sp. SYSU BS000235]|uniref:prepilin peptidase n=1 Tax=Bradyrhizobium sp. SYSU BS000235 TaxID=3411332 RepID=UPI003C70F5CB